PGVHPLAHPGPERGRPATHRPLGFTPRSLTRPEAGRGCAVPAGFAVEERLCLRHVLVRACGPGTVAGPGRDVWSFADEPARNGRCRRRTTPPSGARSRPARVRPSPRGRWHTARYATSRPSRTATAPVPAGGR